MSYVGVSILAVFHSYIPHKALHLNEYQTTQYAVSILENGQTQSTFLHTLIHWSSLILIKSQVPL